MNRTRWIIIFLVLNIFTCAFASGSGWVLKSTNTDNYVGAPVANGGIGILPWMEPFSVRHVILNHVFEKNGARGISRTLQGINPFLLSVEIDGEAVSNRTISDWQQQINMREAAHTTSFNGMNKAEISYQICALRNMPFGGMIQIEIKALEDFHLKVINNMEVPQGYQQPAINFRKVKGLKDAFVFQTSAPTSFGAHEVSAASAFLLEGGSFQLSQNARNGESVVMRNVKKGEKVAFSLVGVICSTRDFYDPYGESERQVVYALHEGSSRLKKAHQRLWDELWEGDIIIEGDDEAQRNVRFALYNLYSYCRENSRLSISPMGLSSQGYNGHIFWDTEIWMYPPMLLLNQGIARSMIDYRTDRVAGARRKAYLHGFKGTMFPWESDDSGDESTPIGALTGPFEHHITADIAIAMWNYYCVTKDRTWLSETGYPLLKEIADFWVSRVEPNPDGSFSICNIIGANEYAEGVDDNAFTNGSVMRALEYACAAAKICNEKIPAEWQTVRKGIRIHRFDDGTTREHKTYDGAKIKQADVNLLGYPLGIISDPATLKKDLNYYADKIDPKHGPAMSYSVFCVQFARLGDSQKAYEMFNKCYKPNLRPPFGVLAETATSKNPYFATGAGGLLQAVINGFGGLQISEKGIYQVPSVLPPHWKKLTIKGVGKDKKTFVRYQ